MLAAFYCQELIRNSHLLCHGYINKLQTSNTSIENPIQAHGNAIPYYVEENERLLNLLITNCEPILSEIT